MAAGFGGSNGSGKAFLIAAAAMLEAIAAACSSPQTLEVNAQARHQTLMKYVLLGLALGGGLVVIGAAVEPENAGPIIAGGVVAGGALYAMYVHARSAGLTNPGPPTEQYGSGSSRFAVG